MFQFPLGFHFATGLTKGLSDRKYRWGLTGGTRHRKNGGGLATQGEETAICHVRQSSTECKGKSLPIGVPSGSESSELLRGLLQSRFSVS